MALRAPGTGSRRIAEAARLYEYTVEFRLMECLRISGSGIASTHVESIFSLDDRSPKRIGFDLDPLPSGVIDFRRLA